MKLRRLLKKIPVLGPVLLAALSYPLVTHAFSVSGIAENVAFFILNIFQIIGGLLFIFAGWVTSIMLDLNYSILEGNTLIMTGWTIVRDIANLGFVLIIIVIAIATILRYKAYGAGQLLTKLIAAAIIVNFSLTIAGVFLDFSHSLTKFFFAPVQGFGDHNVIGIARTLSAAFSPQRFFAEPDIPEITEQGSIFSDIAQGAGSAFMHIASFVFAIIFTFTAAFTLFAFAVLLFLRYIYLSFLLVLAPIVWLFWVVPTFKKYFSDWWSAFVKWTIFAPASAFFIYLSLVSIQAIAGKDAFQSASVFFADGALAAVMKQGVQLFVLTGLFFGSLIVAQKLGVAGASGMIGLAKNAQGEATKWARQKVKRGAVGMKDRALTAGTDEKGQSWVQRQMHAKRGFLKGKSFAAIPLLGRAAVGVSQTSSRAQAQKKERFDEALKDATKMSSEDLLATLNRKPVERWALSDEKRSAYAVQLAKKGKWGLLSDGNQESALGALRRSKAGDDMLAYRPDLAVRFRAKRAGELNNAFENRVIGEAVSKFVKDVNELDESVLKMENVAKHFRPAHYSQLGNNASKNKKEGVKASLETLLGGGIGMSAPQFEGQVVNLLNKLNESIKDIEDARAAGDTVAAKGHIATRDAIKRDVSDLRKKLSADNQKVFKNYIDLYDQTNWGDVLQNVKP